MDLSLKLETSNPASLPIETTLEGRRGSGTALRQAMLARFPYG